MGAGATVGWGGSRAPRLARGAAAVGCELLDLLFPPRCAACGEGLASSRGGPFCAICGGALEPVPTGCRVCGLPGPDPLCGACMAQPPAFGRCRAGGLYGGPLADAVHALKYRGRPALARPLGAWLAPRAPLAPGVAVVSVPLGRRRRIGRGYDQAALLARALARSSGARHLPRALTRIRETPPQVGRTRAERLANVRGAFRAGSCVRGAALVLVDDVVTTGATADACARALLAAGARSVEVLALARAE